MIAGARSTSLARKNILLILGTLTILIVPWITIVPYVLNLMILGMIYAVVAASWDLTLGYSGVFNFGHIAFLGIGGYVAGILSNSFGVDPWTSTLAAGAAALVAGAICGLPSLRLKGIYVCLFSFAFQSLVSSIVLVNPYGLTGGGKGMYGIPAYSLGSFNFGVVPLMYLYYLVFAFFVFSVFMLYRVSVSFVGLSFNALRDHEEYAISRGIDPFKYRMIAWMVSAFFTGLMGGVYVHYTYGISSEIFGFSFLAIVESYLVIGGLGTIYGPVFSSFVMTFLQEYLRPFGAYRFMIVAVATIPILIFAPGGLAAILRRVARIIQGPSTGS